MILIGSVLGDPPKSPAEKTPKESKPEKSNKEPAAFASAELAVLDRFAGPWNVAESHFNTRGEVVGSAKGIEDGAWVLDRKVLQRTYTTGEEGRLFRAIGMISWNPALKRYEGTWFDNASISGPSALSGVWDEAAKTMTFTLTSSAPDGKAVQHKVIDKFLDDEHRVVTTFKVDGALVEKVIEVQFKRAVPCPANVGVIAPEGLKRDR